ncbi:MAG: YraN family protein [Anaerolineaceae bacterium]|jgi:putative endonuclease|nr:YraN family protein [Anaerolineaceae bacterium]
MARRQVIGRRGELRAEAYLARQGYQPVARNVYTPYGEIDLVMLAGEDTVFVEVKTRSSRAYGNPEEAITPRKRVHMLQAAEWYMQHNGAPEGGWRIDVVAILNASAERQEEITWFENAIS